MDYLTPTSELEALNLILSTVAESPVNSLDEGNSADTSQALLMLRNVSRQVQQRGWWFNEEENYPLIPDNFTKNIFVPANTLKVALDDTNVILRGDRLYDKARHSYSFDKAVTATVVFLLAFEELPEAARNLVTHRAGRMFQERMFGSESLSAFNKVDERIAETDLVTADLDHRNPSMLTGSQFAQRLTRRT